MATTWILVANSGLAKLYANHGINKGVALLSQHQHPESRGKGLDLVSDRPGSNQGHGNEHGSFVPATSPKENAADHFALELGRLLEEGRVKNHYERLILVASTPFIGRLKTHLSDGVRKLITGSVDRDYTSVNERELVELLANCAYL